MQNDTLPLIDNYQPSAPIIFNHGQTVSQRDFVAQTIALSQRLPNTPYLINLCRDRYSFALVFCAALIKGAINLLPSNCQLQTLEGVVADYPGCCVVIDCDEALPEMVTLDLRLESLNSKLLDNEPEPEMPRLKSSQLAAIAFTSGTTGKPSPNPKMWQTLAGTAKLLAARFVAAGERPVIVATVPSQHMYGLEMTLMMALYGGSILDSRHPFYADDIAATLASLPNARLLVTTPVHLRTMVGAKIKMPGVTKVISATAPLAKEQAVEAEEIFSAPVEEIYGCTEAGSMATHRTVSDRNWTLLDGMRLLVFERPTGRVIQVQAPHLENIVSVEDHLELIDQNRFRLLGRSVDMINVGGKRASLADLTLKLLAIEGVDDGIVFMADGEEVQQSQRPVALVVSDLSLFEIRAALAQKVDPVFLPRPIKKVAALPRNDTGKLAIKSLQVLLKEMNSAKHA